MRLLLLCWWNTVCRTTTAVPRPGLQWNKQRFFSDPCTSFDKNVGRRICQRENVKVLLCLRCFFSGGLSSLVMPSVYCRMCREWLNWRWPSSRPWACYCIAAVCLGRAPVGYFTSCQLPNPVEHVRRGPARCSSCVLWSVATTSVSSRDARPALSLRRMRPRPLW